MYILIAELIWSHTDLEATGQILIDVTSNDGRIDRHHPGERDEERWRMKVCDRYHLIEDEGKGFLYAGE